MTNIHKDPPLEIDCEKTSTKIKEYIQKIVEEKNASGVLIGISGGIDSAVLIKLAVNTLGKDKVVVVHMPDRDSEQDSMVKAHLLSELAGIKMEHHNIEEEMQKRKVYAPCIMKVNAFSALLNRLFIRIYTLFFRENAFVTTLKKGDCGNRKLMQYIYNHTVKQIEKAFNERHKFRRTYLEEKAKKDNLVLLGTANRSESMVGWFVKDGIDDLYHSPLTRLYKTQIHQLAECLDLPQMIRFQIPSPDMMRGITDELAIGASYAHIDRILDALDQGLNDREIEKQGFNIQEIKLVKDINQLSEWKRSSKHEKPPVDGGINGNVRIKQ